jgi:hypothetical protein
VLHGDFSAQADEISARAETIKIELPVFRFFEEFIMLFKSILFELCETVIAFKNLIILKPKYSQSWNVIVAIATSVA